MVSGTQVLAVEHCEVVPTGGPFLLLRLAGLHEPCDELELRLYVPAGDGGELMEPLPPGLTISADGRWAVAFAVPEDSIGARLALVPSDGDAVAFSARDGELEAVTLPSTQQPEPVIPDGAEGIVRQLRLRCELSERRLAESYATLVQAWAEAGALRDLLESREALHEITLNQERAARDALGEVEERARQSELELSARRTALEEQCELLRRELIERGAERNAAVEDADGTRKRMEELRERSAVALDGFEKARAEADALKSRLAAAEATAEQASEAADWAQRALAEERTKAEAASHRANLLSARLEKLDGELSEARARIDELELAASDEGEQERAEAEAANQRADMLGERLAKTERELGEAAARITELEANASEAVERFEESRAESDRLHAEIATLTSELAELRMAAEAGETTLNELRAAAEAGEATINELRAAGETSEATIKELATSEQALRQELELLTRTDIGEGKRRIGRQPKVSATAYQDALAQLEEEQAQRARLEEHSGELAQLVQKLKQELVEAGEAVAQAENAAADAADQATVEADLRHLLAVTQKDLDEARMSLAEQRTRYAVVATEAATSRAPAPQETPDDEPADEKPWTAVDDELLNRIKRAQESAASV